MKNPHEVFVVVRTKRWGRSDKGLLLLTQQTKIRADDKNDTKKERRHLQQFWRGSATVCDPNPPRPFARCRCVTPSNVVTHHVSWCNGK